MKTLITAVEEWIDLRIFANNKNAIFEAKFKEMLARAHQNEIIAVRDANRIAELERRILILDGDNTYDSERATTIESRLDDLECSMDEKVDSSDVDDRVESAMSDLDLPDSYAIEVMIDDALETKVMDAVRAELDATDFKITVER